MALSIKDPEADRLARALAARTGESITEAVTTALRERLAREERKLSAAGRAVLVEEVMEIARHSASLPVLDGRTLEEMLYDENGLPA